MDPVTIIGIGMALAAIVVSLIMDGGDIGSMILIPPMILVFGGTIGAAVAGGMMPDLKNLPKSIIKAFTAKAIDPSANVAVIVKLAEKARREGLLAMESEVASVDDVFLRKALEMAVDGTDADEVAEILGAEIDAKRSSDAHSAKLFQDMGGFAPTIGIIGTVLGLVHVLGNLGDPSTLGGKIASAFVATLWGVMTANVFWFPIANRLKTVSALECEQMEMTIEGVLAIQAGSNPRHVAQKLNSMIAHPQDAAEPEQDAA
jgi:chemotaxis protein MotA